MNGKTETDRKTPEDGATYAAQAIRETLSALIERDGLSPAEALAGAHAEVVASMVMAYGGQITAERCNSAAQRVAHLPSAEAASRSIADAAGNA